MLKHMDYSTIAHVEAATFCDLKNSSLEYEIVLIVGSPYSDNTRQACLRIFASGNSARAPFV
jgi:hypothetical protein